MVTNSSNDLNGNSKSELNYVTTNRFYIEIGGSIAASFTECSGLGVQIEKEVYFEGGVNDQQRVFLGHSTFSDITFKRGTTDDLNFWEWLSELFGNKPISRRNANIITFNQAGDIMKSWTLIGAIPIAWKSSDLQADGSGVVIEELTLAFEGLKAGKKGGGGNKTKRTATGDFSSF